MKTYFSTKRGGNLLPLGKRCRKHRTKHRTDYSKTRLLIAVKSGVDSFEQRNATRSTFGSLTHKKYSDVAVIHFIARTLDAELQAKVESEQAQFCDLIQFDFVDHYNNITLKSVHIVKFLLDHRVLQKSLQFVLFTDDDTFINLPKLHEELFVNKEIMRSPISIYGHLFHGGGPMYPDPKVKYKDNFTDRSIVPSYMFNGLFPRYISGSGYVLPRMTFQCLFDQAMYLEYLHVEDVFLTGFCAERCGFPRILHPGFSSGRIEPSEAPDSQILIHYMDPPRKRDMFDKLSPPNGL